MRVRLASLFPSRPAGSEKSILFYGYSAQNIRPPISGGGGGSLVRPIFKPPAEFLKAPRLFGSSGPNRAPSKGWMAARERERNTRLEKKRRRAERLCTSELAVRRLVASGATWRPEIRSAPGARVDRRRVAANQSILFRIVRHLLRAGAHQQARLMEVIIILIRPCVQDDEDGAGSWLARSAFQFAWPLSLIWRPIRRRHGLGHLS